MKKLITYILCLVCIMSSLWLGASMFCKNIMQNALVSIAVEEIHLEDKINHFFQSMDIPGKELFANELNVYAKKIARNEKVNEEVNTYLNLVMEDIIYDKESATTSHLNENIKKEIVAYAPEISSLTNQFVAKEDVEVLLNAALANVDFQGVYDDAIVQLKQEITQSEKMVLRIVRFLETDTSQYVALGFVVGLSILIFLLNLSEISGLIYLSVSYGVSAILLLVCKYAIPLAFNFVLSQSKPNVDIVNNADQIGRMSIYFFVACMLCAILKIIYNKIQENR